MSTVANLAKEHQARLARLAEAVSRVDLALAAGRLKQQDVALVYESTFVAAVAEFEATLEEMLVEAVCGLRPRTSGRYPLLNPKSRGHFHTMMLSGRPYIDMLPMKRSIEIARRYLNEGRPFSSVSATDQQTVDEAVLIRNAIAHRSGAALKRFRREVPGVDRLPANQRRPGAYLRRVFRGSPAQTRHEAYFAGLGSTIGAVAAKWR